MMNKGRLEETNTPSGLIDKLGAYAVDEIKEGDMKSRFFHDRDEAIAYLSKLQGQCSMRDTTLEDVFVERVGKHLG